MLERSFPILFLPSLNCLLHVLLRPEFSLGSVWQEEGEREILNIKEAAMVTSLLLRCQSICIQVVGLFQSP